MKLQTKILILLYTTILIFLLFFFSYAYVNFKQKKMLDYESNKNRENIINRIIKLNENQYKQTLTDNSGWDEMVKFVNNPDKKWAENNINFMVISFNMYFVSVYDTDKNQIYYYQNKKSDLSPIIFEKNELDARLIFSNYCHFFYVQNKTLYEIFGASIVPSSDMDSRKTKAKGYLFVSKIWDKKYLDELQSATGLAVNLVISENSNFNSFVYEKDKIYNKISLKDYKNNDIARIIFSSDNNIENELSIFYFLVGIIAFFTIITIIFFQIIIRRILTKPLSKISKSLTTNSDKPLQSLNNNSIEFMQLKEIILKFFEQNEVLKELNIELEQKNEEISSQRDKLSELNITKDKFFSILAHDLKNPFSVILGFSELLTDNIREYSIEKIEYFVTQIYNSATKTNDLLNDLLEWAYSQRGKIQFNPTQISVVRFINEIVDNLSYLSNKKNILLYNIFIDECVIYADKNMLSSIFRNLITNAVKFTNSGGKIIINASILDEKIEFTVSDTGIGVREERLDTLFQIDSYLSSNGTANEKGTGLGLVLCKEFVEKHKGKIWVESVVGEGTVFKFTIPIL